MAFEKIGRIGSENTEELHYNRKVQETNDKKYIQGLTPGAYIADIGNYLNGTKAYS